MSSHPALSGEGDPNLRVYGYAGQSYTDTITGNIWGKIEQSAPGTTQWELVSLGEQEDDSKFYPKSGIPFINIVTDYGAKPDFISEDLPFTDNTPIFQKCVDENPYATIIVPGDGSGRYGFKDTWILNCEANDPLAGGKARSFFGQIIGQSGNSTPVAQGSRPMLVFTNHGTPIESTNSPDFKIGILSGKRSGNFVNGLISNLHISAPRYGTAIELVWSRQLNIERCTFISGRHSVVMSACFGIWFRQCEFYGRSAAGMVSDFFLTNLNNSGRGKSPWDWNDNVGWYECRFSSNPERILNVLDRGTVSTLGGRRFVANIHGLARPQPVMYYGGTRCTLEFYNNDWEGILYPVITPFSDNTGLLPGVSDRLATSYQNYLNTTTDPNPYTEEEYNLRRMVRWESVNGADAVGSIVSHSNNAPLCKTIYYIGKLDNTCTSFVGPDTIETRRVDNDLANYYRYTDYVNSFVLSSFCAGISEFPQSVNEQTLRVTSVPTEGFIRVVFLSTTGEPEGTFDLTCGIDFSGTSNLEIADSLAAALTNLGIAESKELESTFTSVSGSPDYNVNSFGREPTPQQTAEAEALRDAAVESGTIYMVDRPSSLPISRYGQLVINGYKDLQYNIPGPAALVTPTTPPASVRKGGSIMDVDGGIYGTAASNRLLNNEVGTDESIVTVGTATPLMRVAKQAQSSSRPLLKKTITSSSGSVLDIQPSVNLEVDDGSFAVSMTMSALSYVEAVGTNEFWVAQHVNTGQTRGWRWLSRNSRWVLALGNGTNLTSLNYSSSDTLSQVPIGEPVNVIMSYDTTGEEPVVRWFVNGAQIGSDVSAITALGQDNTVDSQPLQLLPYSFTSRDVEVYHFSFARIGINASEANLIACAGGDISAALGVSSSGSVIPNPAANEFFTAPTNWFKPTGTHYDLSQDTGDGTITVTAPPSGFGTGGPSLSMANAIAGGALEPSQVYEVEIVVDQLTRVDDSSWQLRFNESYISSVATVLHSDGPMYEAGTFRYRFRPNSRITSAFRFKAVKNGDPVNPATISKFSLRMIGAECSYRLEDGIGGEPKDSVNQTESELVDGTTWDNPISSKSISVSIGTSGGTYILPVNHRIKSITPLITQEWSGGSSVDVGVSGTPDLFADDVDVTGLVGWRPSAPSLDQTPMDTLTEVIFTVNGSPTDGEAVFYLNLEQLEIE